MSRTVCPDCRITIPNGQAVIRSISLKRVSVCKPCAEDRGWIDTSRPVLSLVAS